MHNTNNFVSNEKSKVSLYQMLKIQMRQFVLNTELHGYKYIGQSNITMLTRFIWIFLTSAAFITGYVLVYLSWQYNINNQFMILADSVHNPIWNYRFPAVTICNLNKVSLKKAKAFAENINKPDGVDTDHILMLMSYLIKILYFQYDYTNKTYYDELRVLLNLNNLTAHEVMFRIRPECKDLLRSCSWKARNWRCDSLFEEVTSVEGLCCATNYYGLKNRMFSGYLCERYKKKPRRVSACGFRTAYKVLMNNMPGDYLVSAISGYGTKVLIHDAYDYPGWSASNMLIPMESHSFISVIPTLTYTTEAIKNTEISERNCVFTWEKSLKYFAKYSYDNCMTECRLDIIKKMCGCVPLYYWNINGYHNITSCDLKDAFCIHAHHDLMNALPGNKYQETVKEHGVCDCIPDCENFEYSIDTSLTTFSRKNALNEIEFFDNVPADNHSVINVFYKDLISMRNKRDLTLTWYAKLAWFGGLLGLCIGFSCTSCFEILYYLTIRVGLDYFYERKHSHKIHIVQPFHKQQLNEKDLEIFTVNRNKRTVQHTVPPMQKLYNLRKTNNEWFID